MSEGPDRPAPKQRLGGRGGRPPNSDHVMDDRYAGYLASNRLDPPRGGWVRRNAGYIDGPMVGTDLHIRGSRGRIGTDGVRRGSGHVIVRDELPFDLHDARNRPDDPRHRFRL